MIDGRTIGWLGRERREREKQNRLLYRDKQRKTVQREGLGNKKSETDTENMRREKQKKV